MTFLLAIVGVIFLIGLVQWARSGAILWDIHQLLKHRHSLSTDTTATTEMDRREKLSPGETLQKSIQHMEITMESFLRSSIKVLSVLALCVWIFVMISVVVDMLGLDWLDRLSFSTNRLIGSPTARANRSAFNYNRAGGASRGNTLRGIGSGLRR